MKNLLLFALFFILTTASPALAAKDIHGDGKTTAALTYSSIMDDLPLMPGMREMPETLVIFDKPEGRIASARVESIIPKVNVTAYYTETLPALGWYPENPQIYVRDNQILTIRFDTPTSILFELAPVPPHKRRIDPEDKP